MTSANATVAPVLANVDVHLKVQPQTNLVELQHLKKLLTIDDQKFRQWLASQVALGSVTTVNFGEENEENWARIDTLEDFFVSQNVPTHIRTQIMEEYRKITQNRIERKKETTEPVNEFSDPPPDVLAALKSVSAKIYEQVDELIAEKESLPAFDFESMQNELEIEWPSESSKYPPSKTPIN